MVKLGEAVEEEEGLEDGEEVEEDQAMMTPHHHTRELEKDLQEIMAQLNKHGDLDSGPVQRQVPRGVILQGTERIDNRIKALVAGVVEVEVEVDGVQARGLEAQALLLPILAQTQDLGPRQEDRCTSSPVVQ